MNKSKVLKMVFIARRGSLKEGLTNHDEEMMPRPVPLSPPNSPSKRVRSPIERSSSENNGIFFSNDNNEGASATDYNHEFMFEGLFVCGLLPFINRSNTIR